ncbi:MAG: hypothetical protein M1835_001090 [Candelina submexicana]|nr:MAG: hypothetical protein M1835_001090 [Candelina submexicana]
MPKQLCGGTYRSSRRVKRKRKTESAKHTLTYAERQQRRIAKRFGTNGIALGEDNDTKVKLEDGKKNKGKPRVAGSARGRELRAAAALRRFNQPEEEVLDEGLKGDDDNDDETESEYEEGTIKVEAFDRDGERVLDSQGHGMIKVCEGEDDGDDDARREMVELQQVDMAASSRDAIVKQEDEATASKDEVLYRIPEELETALRSRKLINGLSGEEQKINLEFVDPSPNSIKPKMATRLSDKVSNRQCPVCSLENEPVSAICVACSNVLDLKKVPNHWRCWSKSCGGGQYINGGDCGVCGICGAKKGQREATDTG